MQYRAVNIFERRGLAADVEQLARPVAARLH